MDDAPYTLEHPNVPAAQSAWSERQQLHVATAYSNPCRWRTRRELLNDFRRHMASSPNVQLHVGELAYGQRPFDVTVPGAPRDHQWRTRSELWHKENLLNLVVQRFPTDWKYGAYIDGDFHFTRPDWALEAVQQLQHYGWVQLFSSYSDLGPDHQILQTNRSFAQSYHHNGFRLPPGYGPGGWMVPERGGYDATSPPGKTGLVGVGATGGAWAFTREAFEAVGGLLDRCILGHADWFMTFGLVAEAAPDMHTDGYTDDYRRYILSWQARARKLQRNIGYVAGHALHYFHGAKTARAYGSRDTILVRHAFNPHTDVYPDSQGVLQLHPDKHHLRDEIRTYFRSRREDQ